MDSSRAPPLRGIAGETRGRGNQLRLFFALWPDDTTRAALARLSRTLHEQCGGRRVPEANVHLTLVFLGNLERELAPALREMAGGVRGAAFDLVLDTVDYWRHNDIVWIGARACPQALRELVAQLTRGTRRLDIAVEKRDYVPHITLLRRAERGPAALTFDAIEWRAAEFALVQSAPRTGGVAYERIAHWPLAAVS